MKHKPSEQSSSQNQLHLDEQISMAEPAIVQEQATARTESPALEQNQHDVLWQRHTCPTPNKQMETK